MQRAVNRLKKEVDFRRIYRKGRKINGLFFDIIYLYNLCETRYGVIATTKTIKKATKRNTAKRRTRSLINKNKNIWPERYDIIVKIKKMILNEQTAEAEKEMINAFRVIKNDRKNK